MTVHIHRIHMNFPLLRPCGSNAAHRLKHPVLGLGSSLARAPRAAWFLAGATMQFVRGKLCATSGRFRERCVSNEMALDIIARPSTEPTESIQKVPREGRKFAAGGRITTAMRSLVGRVVTALALVLALADGRGHAQGGILRVGLPVVPATLDPALASEAPAGLVMRQIFDTLLQYKDGSSDVEPALATQWQVSRDGLVWSFRLREGVRFHDGTPLTSAQIAASLARPL